jgi:hypothetical protein
VVTLPKNRYALLIASTAYEDPDLRKLTAPGKDVKALADVLANPQVGGFNVTLVVDKPWWVVQQEIARFFANRDHKDVLLLYFSCHGIKNDDGHLYFATCDTDRKIIRASAIPDDFVQEHMRTSWARQQVLILDCCYGGFFTNRMLAKSDDKIDDVDRFQGSGAVILTGSSAIQYAFEGNKLKKNSQLSVFTSSLVKGLGSGAADLDGDGLVSPADLIGYARRQMRDMAREQTPTLSTIGQEGEVYIAAVPASNRKKWQIGAPVRSTPDGWVDLTKLVPRSQDATDRDAVIIAMELSLAFHGKRVSLSQKDLHDKLFHHTKQKPDTVGFVVADMMYVIDHLGVKAERSKKIYTARSFRLSGIDEAIGQLRLGRPLVTGLTWRQRWFEEPILKTGILDFKRDDRISGGSMITIVGCNEEDMSMRFMWRLAWGERGLGWISKATAAACLHDNLYSIEAAEFTMPYTRH